MPYTEASREKLRQSMIKRYGSLEKWREHRIKMSSKGGRNGKGGGFATLKITNPDLHKKISAKGGKNRGKNESK